MEKVLVNPTLEHVNAELAALCTAANKGQRTRTATMQLDAAEWAADRGLYRAGGDGVNNSYGSRASTTVVGAAWVTLNGSRVVRLEASRTDAIASAYGRREKLPFGFNGAITRWEKADEGRVVRGGLASLARRELGAAPQFVLSVFNEADRLTAAVAADWLEENDLPAANVRLWLALCESAAVTA